MEEVLVHHGILGMKWGIRRYQNPDGSLTAAGKRRYKTGDKMKIEDSDTSVTKKVKNDYNKMSDREFRSKYQTSKKTYMSRVNRYGDPYRNRMEKNKKISNMKKKLSSSGAIYNKKSGSDYQKKRFEKYNKKANSKMTKQMEKQIDRLVKGFSGDKLNDKIKIVEAMGAPIAAAYVGKVLSTPQVRAAMGNSINQVSKVMRKIRYLIP